MNRMPLIALALRCRQQADEFAIASKIARDIAEQFERVICFGSDAEVAEALKVSASIPEPNGSSI